ncbi:tRNA (adenosine(37)-N6)-threonylcarbamoyltransferase complex dimerization subunit type 1 TsaB [uncultured Umboniibacter sp.]|uniref:tRNA (adenosine(37)-N6)-threonylcarbamoyltransferase complex dimerization subunit type 1 TsaB n=1 Tax=uncultured Umboniibacter sp. TaxID=1798917 RepID=UPI0026094593|nr:tRNA (adenosine(37)-N6)-threonylcarbamoyltransferase complex dimerization subunit type 1 TsaB [uncultured Umboniibacter sp.]
MSKAPTILALDTSTDACSVALLSAEGCVQRFEQAARQHTKRLLPMVDDVLAEAQLTLNDVDCIAYGAGPGSFTGLRICLGVVQGLAFSVNKPVVGVSTLGAMALQAAEEYEVSRCHVIQDARMSECYEGIWERVGDTVIPVLSDRLISPDQIEVFTADEVIIGTGFEMINDAQRRSAGTKFKGQIDPQAAFIARLAVEAFVRGDADLADDVEPVYLRNEVSWKKRVKLVDQFKSS